MPPKRKTRQADNQVINFYALPEVQAFSSTSENPNFDVHGIKVPFRMGIIGASGSMKTNCLINLLKIMPRTFTSIQLFCKSASEPLYDWLKTKIDPSQLEIYDGDEVMDKLNSIDINNDYKDKNTLVVFDDLVLEKDQSKIAQFYIRGRKQNVSCVYISQKFTKIPTVIRGQFSYLIIKKISSKYDLRRILADSASTSLTIDQVFELYKYATRDNGESFFLLDFEAPSERLYRKNWDVIDISELL